MESVSLKKIVDAICHLPRDFQRRGNISMVALLKESGYLRTSENITEQLLKEYFEKHRDLIDAWVRNSEDTRGSPNWYLSKPTEPKESWAVGFFPDGSTYRFPEGAQACAFYVKRYLEMLRAHVLEER